MKLYYSPGSCAMSTHIVLLEADADFELVKVDLKAKKFQDGDFLKVNPKGYVPTLELQPGKVLTENAVILQYIADQTPDKPLFPLFGSSERYYAMEWLNFIATELHKGFGVMFSPKLKDDAKAVLTEKLQLRLQHLESHLAANKFILGSEFSIADAYAFNVLNWAGMLNVDLSSYKGILGFMERMQQRPSVRKALKDEGLAN